MSETKPIKPEAKHKNQNKIPRPTTEGHIVTDTINPELERNQPDYTEDKIKLNLDAKPFISQKLESRLYNKGRSNNPETDNNYNYYFNARNSMNNMNGFSSAPPFAIQMPLQVPQNFNNPHFNNINNNAFNQRASMPMYHPPGAQNYPPYNDYHMNPGKLMHQSNYRSIQYGNKPSREYYNNPKPMEQQTKPKVQTGLDINSKPFNPRKNKEEKNEKEEKIEKKKENDISLNINANPYQPRNIQLKEKEDLAHSNQEVKKKDNPLDKIFNDNNSKNTTEKPQKISHNRESEKNSSTNLRKKNSKKNELDKKLENLAKATEKSKREEEERKRKEKEAKRLKEEEEKRIREEERKRKEERKKD